MPSLIDMKLPKIDIPVETKTKQLSSMSNEAQARRVWRAADAVCFDVDSTVCTDEGLDELAEFCGVGPQVAEWTNKAMGGGVTFREALRHRLNIVKPSKKQVLEFVDSHPPRLTPGIKELVIKLRAMNKKVFLVSGGFKRIITPVANALSIPVAHIYANNLLFNEDGSYGGFDLSEPTSESGGKKRVAHAIMEKYQVKSLVAIGDGVTDMEAYPPADTFIGFGGNVVRAKVKNSAPWFVMDFQELIDELS